MNTVNIKKKKIGEYQIEDIKEIFTDVLKKISSKIILLEIGNDFLNLGLAKSSNNKLFIKKVFNQALPKEAIDKSLPSDPINFGIFLNKIINENKINCNRIAVSLSSDACYTKLINIPEEINEEKSIEFLENPNSGIQIPISLANSDFDIKLTNLPKKKIKNKIFNQYFLTSIPKKNIDLIFNSIKSANLEICSIQMSHMCVANLLKTEIRNLNDNELIISVDLLDEFTQIVIFDNSGPLLIKRLASIRNYPSIEDLKIINKNRFGTNKDSKNEKKAVNYHALSKLDLKVLLREISGTFNNFLNENNLNKEGKIFLSGRNSQHENLVEIIGNNLKMNVSLVSPINNFNLEEFAYNPDEINQFSMSRLIGLGLTLLKDNELKDESLNKGFIIKSFSIKDDIKKDNRNFETSKKLINQDKKIKGKSESKVKSEETKKELPPLPNIKIKGKSESKVKSEETKKENSLKKKNSSFKMDTSFLKND